MARKRLKPGNTRVSVTPLRDRIRKEKALLNLYSFNLELKDVFRLWNVVSLSCKHRIPHLKKRFSD